LASKLHQRRIYNHKPAASAGWLLLRLEADDTGHETIPANPSFLAKTNFFFASGVNSSGSRSFNRCDTAVEHAETGLIYLRL
jgi:hypothetical protein